MSAHAIGSLKFGGMSLGLFLPVSGRAAGTEAIVEAAIAAEASGFGAVWSGERAVQPTQVGSTYPYGEGAGYPLPFDSPFLDALTTLAFVAGRTSAITVGVSVSVLPLHHPLQLARVASTLGLLSGGRFVLGVGVGWMQEEFAALGVSFKDRGRMSDQHLEVVRRLWKERTVAHDGQYYPFTDVGFEPKYPVPIWVGGEGKAARRRAGYFGDSWFPQFVRITPKRLAELHQEVRVFADQAGRDPDAVRLAACAPVEITAGDISGSDDQLRGSAGQVRAAIESFAEVGVDHLALRFTAPTWSDRKRQFEQLARVLSR